MIFRRRNSIQEAPDWSVSRSYIVIKIYPTCQPTCHATWYHTWAGWFNSWWYIPLLFCPCVIGYLLSLYLDIILHKVLMSSGAMSRFKFHFTYLQGYKSINSNIQGPTCQVLSVSAAGFNVIISTTCSLLCLIHKLLSFVSLSDNKSTSSLPQYH